MASYGDKVARNVGDAIVVKFGLLDNGTFQTGLSASITVTVYDEADASFSTPSISEAPASSGIYEFSFTPDAQGQWTAKMVESTIPAGYAWMWEVMTTVTGDKLDDIETDTQAIEADTQDIQSRLPAALVGGLMDSNVGAISADTTAADNLELDYDGTGLNKANSTIGTCTTLTGHTPQTGDNFARLGAPAGASVSADIASIQTDTDAIEVDTQDIQSTLATNLPDVLSLANINNEVVDVMTVDTVTLPGQTAPTATPTMQGILGWIYKVFRNKKTQTATTWSLFDDAGTTVDAKATVSDDGTTATKGEVATGP